jgi:hypothetical protein
MSDPATEPQPEPPSAPEPAPASPPPRQHLLPWLSGGGFLVLLVGLIVVWLRPLAPPPVAPQSDALARQVAELQARVAGMAQRPAPDAASLESRLAALEQRPPQPAPAPDLGGLASQVAALEQRQPPDIAPLRAQLSALASQDQAALGNLSHRVDTDEARLSVLENAVGRATRAEAVRIALESGQKLGAVPGVPPALARFADTNPPTETQLRFAFPQAARNALAASRPATEGKPLLTRLWLRAQDLVTVRQGDQVLVGDPVAGVLNRAREAVNGGDLAGAVTAVGSLSGPAAAAMAGWLAQARSLLEARAALAAWAAQG